MSPVLRSRKSPAEAGLSSYQYYLGAWPVVVDLALGALALACWATQLLTKSRRFKKWMAEYFLAAWALHEACTCADTFCLFPAASADTAKDATSAVASVEISSFFMFISPLPPNATETLNHASSFRIFSCQFVQK
jgi:hypothetical protein